MRASERYRVALNILAKVGLDGDLQGEYARTMASLHGLESFNAMQTQMPAQTPVQNAPTMPQEPLQSTNVNQPIDNTTMQQEGQGSLNLP